MNQKWIANSSTSQTNVQHHCAIGLISDYKHLVKSKNDICSKVFTIQCNLYLALQLLEFPTITYRSYMYRHFYQIRSNFSCTSVVGDCDEQITTDTNTLFIGDECNRELFSSFHKLIVDNSERYRAKRLKWLKRQICRD